MPDEVVTPPIPSNCLGVDGCRAGWIGVTRSTSGLVYGLYQNMQAVLDAWPAATKILVDIPIGMPWSGCTSRPCDSMARRALGPRASSVFSPPARQAARAANIDQARALNIDEVGRSLSAQAWGICKKIAEVDELLLRDAWAREELEVFLDDLTFVKVAIDLTQQRKNLDDQLNLLATQVTTMQAFHDKINEFLSIDATIDGSKIAAAAAAGSKADVAGIAGKK